MKERKKWLPDALRVRLLSPEKKGFCESVEESQLGTFSLVGDTAVAVDTGERLRDLLMIRRSFVLVR